MRHTALFIALFMLSILAAPFAYAADPIGVAAVVRGKVTVTNEAGETRAIASKSPLFQNETITTGKEAQLQIIFNDETIFTVGRNSEVILDTFIYDPATSKGESVINVTRGFFKFLSGKIAKEEPENVKVKTPFATIGIRGSGGMGSVAPDGQTMVGLTVCCLDVSTEAGTVPLETPNFFTTISDPNQPPSPPFKMDGGGMARLNQALAGQGGDEDDGGEGDDGAPGGEGNDGTPAGEGTEGDEGATGGDDTGGEGRPARRSSRDGGEGAPPPAGEGGDGSAPPPGGGDFGGDGPDGGGLGGGGFGGDGPDLGGDLNLDTAIFSQDDNRNTNTNDDDVEDTHFGGYRIRVAGGTAANDEEGDVSANILGGQLRADFSPVGTAGDRDDFKGILPKPPGTGSVIINPFRFDDVDLSGNAFISPNDAMIFYNLTEPTSGDKFVISVGRTLAESAIPTSNPNGGTVPLFFSFLADGLIPSGEKGFFDLQGSGPTTPSDVTLALDLSSDSLIAADLFVGGAIGSPRRTRLRVAFGEFDNDTDTEAVIDGATYGFDTLFDPVNGEDGRGEIGIGDFEVVEIFGIDNGTNVVIDGFLLETDNRDGNGFGTTLRDSFSVNPAVVGATPSDAAQLFSSNVASTQHGFSAGFLSNDVLEDAGAPDFSKYLTINKTDLTINQAVSSIGATFDYTKFGAGGFGPVSLTAKFGDDASANNLKISDKAYAAEVADIEYNGVSVNDFEGVLVSEIASESLCSGGCNYVTWGLWAAKIQDAVGTPDDIDVAELIPYVAANNTDITSFSQVGGGMTGINATYTGKAFGSVIKNNEIQHGFGQFSMDVNFTSDQVTSFSLTNFNGFNITDGGAITITDIGGTAHFNISNLTGGNGTDTLTSGAAFGVFAGPNAEEALGRIDFDFSGGGGAGVFAGAR